MTIIRFKSNIKYDGVGYVVGFSGDEEKFGVATTCK
jgi:hypothetical protein